MKLRNIIVKLFAIVKKLPYKKKLIFKNLEVHIY